MRVAGISLGLFLLMTQAQAESGIASFYDYPQKVACGGRYDRNAMTAAHRTLPCGTKVRVNSGVKSIVVTINDRGPFIRGRIIDLSYAAASQIGMLGSGLIRVTLEVIK